MLKFTRDDGTSLRPGFSCVEEMDEHLIEQWNSVVKPRDRVYHLGDVVMKRKQLPILDRLNGKKKLVMGNHDIFKAKDYLKYFEDVMGVRVYPKHDIICSHYPLHESSLWAFKAQRPKINIHGHTHWRSIDDLRYINISVEQLDDYKPISFEQLLEMVEQRRETMCKED